MAGIRNSHAKPPTQKEAVSAKDIIAMVETLDRSSWHGLRDRAMLLIGFADSVRRSQIAGLDLRADQTEDGRGWTEILNKGMLVTPHSKSDWREVGIGRGAADAPCPIAAIEARIKFTKLAHGALFRRMTGQSEAVGSEKLKGKQVARVVKRAAMSAGVLGDLRL